jgi:hypothetical protein
MSLLSLCRRRVALFHLSIKLYLLGAKNEKTQKRHNEKVNEHKEIGKMNLEKLERLKDKCEKLEANLASIEQGTKAAQTWAGLLNASGFSQESSIQTDQTEKAPELYRNLRALNRFKRRSIESNQPSDFSKLWFRRLLLFFQLLKVK